MDATPYAYDYSTATLLRAKARECAELRELQARAPSPRAPLAGFGVMDRRTAIGAAVALAVLALVIYGLLLGAGRCQAEHDAARAAA